MTHSQPRFLLDENLNRLAKWLRLLGYDAAVYKAISRQKQIHLANKEFRILLTRDKKTAKSKLDFHRIYIKSDDHIKQLKEIRNILQLDEDLTFSRCLECNKVLFEIRKAKIRDLVPPFIFDSFNEFKLCRRCGKIFWKGSHYKAMQQKLTEIFSA